jgi:TolB-like protein/DNA-binding winged helix-turn-helix (wHTH) protein
VSPLNQHKGPVSFGSFQLDLCAGELRQEDGSVLRLPEQPLKILALLLENSGNVVTREQIRKRLWPDDTTVEFEHSISAAVNRLRQVLGDSAESPRFIETLARRGYRFVAPIDIESHATTEPLPAGEPETRGSGVRFRHRQAVTWSVAAASILLAAGSLIWANVGGLRDRWAPNQKERIRALAVLPLANLSSDSSQEYFADAVTSALIAEMGGVGDLRVISRQSTMQYKGSQKSLQAISAELKVDAVLEGTVERSGDRVRVTVHLDQVSPERELWARQFNGNLANLMNLQDDIARSIAGELKVKLTPEQRARLVHSKPVNPEAQDDYLRGTFSLQFPANPHAALAAFRQAVEKDPEYARAYSALAMAYLDAGSFGESDRPSEVMVPAKAAALKALELDPSLGDAHLALAATFFWGWDWAGAEREYQTAVHLNPSDPRAHEGYALFLSAVERHNQALAESRYAVELDPYNLECREALGDTELLAGQFDLAIKQFAELGSYNGLAWAYLGKKMYPKAIAAMEKHAKREGRDPFVLSMLAEFYGFGGRRRAALQLIAELKTIARHQYVPPGLFYGPYLGLGDNNQALTWLERGFEEREQALVWAKVWPGQDRLRSEPRFQAVLNRLNFPQP